MLRNDEYTDRELLNIIISASRDGMASTLDIAQALGVGANGKSPSQRVAPRLSAMKRLGFLEAVDPPEQGYDSKTWKGKWWVVTDVGRQMAGGRLTKSAAGALEKMDPGALLLAQRTLARRALVDERVAHAVRREYLNASGRRR